VAVNWRNRRYDRAHTVTRRVGVPVISVGNLTLGGTGKTPFVKWIAGWLGRQDVRVAIVSRGYGATRGRPNDEAMELADSLPGVPHLQSADRVAAALRAVSEHGAEVIVLDDGFQHRRLARDLDIVLLDASRPFGFGHVFPRGLLREPASGLARANVVCLSRADMVDEPTRQEIRDTVAGLAPRAIWCELVHVPLELRNTMGETKPVTYLFGQRVAAFCGIGNPAAFRHTLESLGAEIVAWCAYADHHAFTKSDLRDIAELRDTSGAGAVVCTHKDLVKVRKHTFQELSPWGLMVGVDFLTGADQFTAALRQSSQIEQIET
jgi:tetraacyldisaccharide 4'-kinase